MAVKLICVDMDGTLLNADHLTISPENRRAVAFAESLGVRVVPATGRIVSRLAIQLESLPFLRWAIVSNGSEVADLARGRVLGGSYIPPADTLRILDLLKKEGLPAMVYQGERMLITPEDLQALRAIPEEEAHLAQLLSLQTTVEDLAAHFAQNPDRIQKINVPHIAPEERRQKLLARFTAMGTAQVTTSMPHNIEFNAPGSTKAVGLAVLCKELGIHPDETAAIGDGANDLALFAAAGVAVAMGNAADTVKAAADWVTDTNTQDGVAKAIYRLLGQTPDKDFTGFVPGEGAGR